MTIFLNRAAVLASLLSLFCSSVGAQSMLEQIETAVSEGSVELSLRARLETVAQDNALQDAAAATLRTRLTLKSGVVGGFGGLLELDNVSSIGADQYDSLIRDRYRGSYSIIADPVGAEVNQAYLSYAPDESQSFRLGMQRVNHASQRFVGSVGWRQNEQTLDAISYSRKSSKLSLDYSYVWNVNRIFGASRSSVQDDNLDSASHIAIASYKTDMGSFSGFLYALDFDDAAALSSLTAGMSFAHTFAGFAVSGSLARQSDHGSNATSYEANYIAADIAYNLAGVKLLLGYESLGSDDGVTAFQTPLATLHKWQGWTDLFLTTPAAGLDDSYLSLSGKLGKLNISASYHRFSAEDGGMGYGSEWDAVASYPLRSNVSVELKYATYDADGLMVDTDKFWFSVNLVF